VRSAEQADGLFRQAIACSRREAGEAARDVLLQGGNAIDAAVAALLVQCVIEPSNVGLGGYGGSLVYYAAATGRVHAIDFDSRAPRKFDPTTFNEAAAVHGYLAVGVPGIPAGIELALRKYGRIPFTTLAKDALALAENGIDVTAQLARSFERPLCSPRKIFMIFAPRSSNRCESAIRATKSLRRPCRREGSPRCAF
jgi:gamma-glutamyltranspeptidase